jgi:hypothetical protein
MNSRHVRKPAGSVARIRLSELKALIREAVEEAMHQRGEEEEALEIDEAELDELDQGWGDDTDYTGGSQGKPGDGGDYKGKGPDKREEEPYTGSY